MSSDGPRDEKAKRQALAGNVIRLPRSWMPPDDELVPIGREPPGRGPAPDTSRAVDAAPRAIDGVSASPDPLAAPVPSAQSFWGPDSALLHAPIQAPAPLTPVASEAASPPAPVSPATVPGAPGPAAGRDHPVAYGPSSLPAWPRSLAVTALAVVVTVAVVAALGSGSRSPRLTRVAATGPTALSRDMPFAIGTAGAGAATAMFSAAAGEPVVVSTVARRAAGVVGSSVLGAIDQSLMASFQRVRPRPRRIAHHVSVPGRREAVSGAGAAQPSQSAPTPTQSATPATGTPVAASPSTGSAASAPTSSASTTRSTGHGSPFGEYGALGPGHSIKHS